MRRVLLLILAFCFGGLAYLIIRMEGGLAERQKLLGRSPIFWTCSKIPPSNVLARVLAGRVLVEHQGHGRGPLWHPRYAAYTLYYRWRVTDANLVENYLKSSSYREKNCRQVRPREEG